MVDRPFSILETARLRVRKLAECDRAAVRALFADPAVMRHYRAHCDPQAGERWMRAVFELYARHGFGPWTLELRDGSFVGQCGPVPQNVEGKPEIEVICFLARAFWRGAYADEAAEACTQYVVATMRCPHPIALVGLENRASRRLAKRRGYRYERDVVMDGIPMHLLRRPARA